jgi:hypothetical protein
VAPGPDPSAQRTYLGGAGAEARAASRRSDGLMAGRLIALSDRAAGLDASPPPLLESFPGVLPLLGLSLLCAPPASVLRCLRFASPPALSVIC